ncbi:TraB/GumN family protein [Rheinheimera soli]|uniref:TraB/GumN family protein n=1 Tax=Rheinheimera soli TaxID=443616 RepID=UPI001E53218E
MSRIFLSCILLLLSSTVSADGVWKISKGKQHFYLAGSVHMLSAQDYPLPPEYLLALQQSDSLVLETDLEQLSSPSGIQQMISLNSYPSGENLLQHLSAPLAKQLADYCRQHKIPLEQITRFKPAFAAIMLTTTQLQAQGANAPGVDAFLQDEAKKSGKKIAGLETMQQHLDVITELNNSGAETLIKSTMDDLKDSSEDFDAMRKAWRSGDLEQLDHLYLDDLKNYPAIYQTLIVKRNNAWVKQLVAEPKTKPFFVVVGALHLAGDQGLIEQLTQQGYQITPLKDKV